MQMVLIKIRWSKYIGLEPDQSELLASTCYLCEDELVDWDFLKLDFVQGLLLVGLDLATASLRDADRFILEKIGAILVFK